MQVLSHSEIQKLTNKKTFPSVSLFMNTEGLDFFEIRARFRQLLNETRQVLSKTRDFESRHETLHKGYRLVHDREFWDQADKSVAVYLSKDTLEAYHLPEELEEGFSISRGFNVLPLLEQINIEGTYYILALSRKRPRLYWSDHMNISEIKVSDFETLLDDEHEEKVGHLGRYADSKRMKQIDIFKTIHQIDDIITPIIREQKVPLVLAGLPHMVALFKKLTRYNHVVAKSINRSPDRLSPQALRDRAWPLVESYFKADERLAKTQLERLSQTQPQRVLRGAKKILQAVQQGRVQTLFIDTSSHIWGKINPSAHITTVHKRHMPGDSDLLNLAVSETLSHSGNVFAMDSKQFPKGVNSIAILRY